MKVEKIKISITHDEIQNLSILLRDCYKYKVREYKPETFEIFEEDVAKNTFNLAKKICSLASVDLIDCIKAEING